MSAGNMMSKGGDQGNQILLEGHSLSNQISVSRKKQEGQFLSEHEKIGIVH